MNQLFMKTWFLNHGMESSYWRKGFSKSIRGLFALLVLTMLIPTISMAQTADPIYPDSTVAPDPTYPSNVPCLAHRWYAGDGWRKSTSTGQWEAIVVNSPGLQPKGIVRCASSAETESQLQRFKGPYDPTVFPVPSIISNGFDMNGAGGGSFGATVNGPTAGEDIVWFNFDIRPLAGTYQFQVVTNSRVGWALYYVDPAFAQPVLATTGTIYPSSNTGPGSISGDCNQLVPALLNNAGVPADHMGLSGNGWSTITVPSFKKPTNYYLAMWMESLTETTFPSSMNLVYKSRYGCGGATCTLEYLNTTVSCTAGGKKRVCGEFGGSAGRWIVQDLAPVAATSYSVELSNQNGVPQVPTLTSTNLTSTPLYVNLGVIPDGAVFAKVCADYGLNDSYYIKLAPDVSFSYNNNYITCTDTASFSGNETPATCTIDASVTGTGVIFQPGVSLPGVCPKVYQFNVTAPGQSATLQANSNSGSSVVWSVIPPPIAVAPAGSYSFSGNTFTVLGVVAPGNYFQFIASSTTADGCKCFDTLCIEVITVCPSPFQIGGPSTVCNNSQNIQFSYPSPLNTADFKYEWTVSSGASPSSFTDVQSISVNANGSGNSFYVVLVVKNRGFDYVCAFDTQFVTINKVDACINGGNQTVCNASQIVSYTCCSTGSGTLTYQWQKASSCAGTFSNIPVTTCAYKPTGAGAYRLIAASTLNGLTCYDTSNCVTVIVSNPEAGDISGDQSICSGGCPSAITGGAPTLENGCNAVYIWQSASSCSGPWSTINGIATQNYTPSCGLTGVTSYRRITAVTCGGFTCYDTSNCVTISLINYDGGDITGDQTICKTSCPTEIQGNTVTANGCTVRYTWQFAAACGGPWVTIPCCTNSPGYLPPCGIESTTSFRRITAVTCGGFTCYDTSNCVTLTIINPEGGDISGNQTICSGGCPSPLVGNVVTANGCTVGYVWQKSASCSGPWVNAQCLTPSYPVPCGLTQTTSYRRITFVTCGNVTCYDTSNCVTITVNSVDACINGGNQTVCSVSQITGYTCCSTGSGTLTYQWQKAATCAGPFSNIAVTTCNYTPTAAGAYRLIAASTLNGITCYDTSSCVTISINSVDACINGGDQTVCSVSQITGYTCCSTGSGTLSYQWQKATTCAGPFSNIAVTTCNYTPTAAGAYRLIAASTLNGVTCYDTSNCVTVTINSVDACINGGNQTVCSVSQITGYTCCSTGSGTLSYQWQKATTCAGPFSNIAVTTCNYTPTAAGAYRLIAASTLNGITCYDTSNCVTVTINSVDACINGGNQTVCSVSQIAAYTCCSTGSGTLSYQWQKATTCAGPFSNIAVTTCNYTPTAAGAYRLIAASTLNGVTCYDTSNCVTVTINSVDACINGGNQTVCEVSQIVPYTCCSTGSGTLSYQWQSASTCAGPFTNMDIRTCNFTPVTGGAYRLIVGSTLNDITCYDTSNCVTVTINTVDAGMIYGDTVICVGQDPIAFTSSPGTGAGTISYVWLISTTGCMGPWDSIPSSNVANYDPGVVSSNTYFKRITKSLLNGVVCSDTSNCVSIITNECGYYCTYTQGYYGSPGKSCDGVVRYNSATELLKSLLGVGSTPRPLIMGDGVNQLIIPGTAEAAVKLNSILPGGKTPRALPSTLGVCDIMNPCLSQVLTLQGRINNVFLSQALVLSLNARLNGDKLAGFKLQNGWLVTGKRSGCGELASTVSCSSSENSVSSRQMNSDVISFLTKGGTQVATVQDLIALANKLLGGTYVPGQVVGGFTVPSYSAVSGACGFLNEVFDECRTFLGWRTCQTTCSNYISGCATPSSTMYEKGQEESGTLPVTMAVPQVFAFPNPYFDNVNFVIESPKVAKGSLKIYNAMGQLVSVVFQGEVSAGKSKNIRFKVPVSAGGLFYVYEQDGRKITGKLIKQ